MGGHDAFYDSILTLAAVFMGALVVGRMTLGGFNGLLTRHTPWIVAIGGEVSLIVAGALAVQGGLVDDSDGIRLVLLLLVVSHLGSTVVALSLSKD